MGREGIDNYDEIMKCQILDKYNLAETKVPAVTIKPGYIRFNMQAIHLLEDTPYIELFFNDEEKYMLAVPCGKYDIQSIDWCRKKNSRVEAKDMRSKFLSPKVYKMMSWNSDYSYKVQCYHQTFDNGKSLLFFDLTEFVTLVTSSQEGANGKRRNRTKSLYLASWQDSFGPPANVLMAKVNQEFMGYYIINPDKEPGEDKNTELPNTEVNKDISNDSESTSR